MIKFRRCFAEPTAEENLALDKIEMAVEAHLSGDIEIAEILLQEVADLPKVAEHRNRIAGPLNTDFHWKVAVELPPLVPLERRPKRRMPGLAVQRAVFVRDGYRCRFCGQRLAPPEVVRAIKKTHPRASRVGACKNAEQNTGLILIQGVIDHVVPHRYGGTNEPSNLVATCGKCNYGRNDFTLEQLGMLDPREYPPVLDQWDGLTRILGERKSRNSPAKN
jgi:5-methylcytosine-specific restriction endonuclease McrA